MRGLKPTLRTPELAGFLDARMTPRPERPGRFSALATAPARVVAWTGTACRAVTSGRVTFCQKANRPHDPAPKGLEPAQPAGRRRSRPNPRGAYGCHPRRWQGGTSPPSACMSDCTQMTSSAARSSAPFLCPEAARNFDVQKITESGEFRGPIPKRHICAHILKRARDSRIRRARLGKYREIPLNLAGKTRSLA